MSSVHFVAEVDARVDEICYGARSTSGVPRLDHFGVRAAAALFFADSRGRPPSGRAARRALSIHRVPPTVYDPDSAPIMRPKTARSKSLFLLACVRADAGGRPA